MYSSFIQTLVAGPSSLAAANTDLLTGQVNGWYDAEDWNSGSIQIIASAGISAGTVIFEQTNDPGNPGAVMPVKESGVPANGFLNTAQTIAQNTNRIFLFPVLCRYIRVRIATAFTGGTVRAVASFNTLPFAALDMVVFQASASSLNLQATLLASTALAGGVGLRPETGQAQLTNFRLASSAASTNATLVATGARKLFAGWVRNSVASVRFLKLYNKATAPVPGTDTPVATIEIPASGQFNLAPFISIFGEAFPLGLGFAITGALADADTTAIGAGDIMMHLRYV